MKTRDEILNKAADIVAPKFNASPADKNLIEAKLDLLMWVLGDTDLDEIYEILSIREAKKEEVVAWQLKHGMMVYYDGKFRVLTDIFQGIKSVTLIFDYVNTIYVGRHRMFTVLDQDFEG